MTKSHKVTLASFGDVSLTLESSTEDNMSFAVYSDFDEPDHRYIHDGATVGVLRSFHEINRIFNREVAR